MSRASASTVRARGLQAVGIAVAIALASAAQAQEASGTVPTLQEIVVTAQKRAQREIDVPVSISAIDTSAIASTGARDLEDLQFTVPGLAIRSYGAGADNYEQLRGISSAFGLPTVGNYFGELPINIDANGVEVPMPFVDLERVEVLRGPQPTLYGDGSMGGTIRYIPAPPSLDQTSAQVTSGVDSMNGSGLGWLTNGYLNIPLASDLLGLRLAGGYEKDPGWIDRVPTGETDINDSETGTMRVTLLAKLGDDSDLSVLFQHDKTSQPNQNFGIDGKTYLSVSTPVDTETNLASLVLRLNLGFAELVETPGYMTYRSPITYDLSSFYLPYLAEFGLPNGYVTEIPYDTRTDDHTFTNELRLVSKSDGAWSWASGVDYRDARYDLTSANTTYPNPLPFYLVSDDESLPDKSWALWVDTGYAITSKWRASVGVRYYHDQVSSATDTISFGAPQASAGQATFTSTNPRFDLSYKIGSDSLLYMDVAKGFRSGGFNAAYASQPSYAPDELWTYELGSKGLYWDRKLQLEAAVYYNDWKDVQTEFYTPLGLEETTNGGRVQGEGFDLSATLNPVAGLQLGVTAGWNNMSYTEVPANGDKKVGDPPDFTIRQSWSAFADYRHAVWSGASAYGRVEFQHANRALLTLRSPAYASLVDLPPRSLLNLRVGLAFARYDIAAFCDNVLNESNPIITGPFGVVAENIEQRPREYGLSATLRF